MRVLSAMFLTQDTMMVAMKTGKLGDIARHARRLSIHDKFTTTNSRFR